MKRAAPEQGYALIGVVMFGLMTMLVLAVGFENLHQASVLHRSASASTAATANEQALGRALALLQSGVPAVTPFVCRIVLDSGSGAQHLAVTFQRIDASSCPSASGECWEVTANPWEGLATEESACPLTFGSACPGGGL